MSQPDLDALGALADPTRRAVYQVVAAAGPQPVSRDEVAEALGVGRTLAAFHLDKLVDAGLLDVSFARRTGRSGPGAGRTAKLYRRAATEHAVAVPPRSYHGAAEILAEALDRAGADETLFAVARERGQRQGFGLRAQGGPSDRIEGVAQAEPGQDLVTLLAARGYEPVEDAGVVRLRNCPFHRLAEDFPPLVCGMNLALIEGILDGSGLTSWRAATDPAPGYCCVAISKTNVR
jgi:predicted ArsR family transcriptional regulator